MLYIKASAQISIMGGVNYSNVRNNHLLENEKAVFTGHYGISFRYYPIKNWSKFSIQNELMFNRKGYQQHLDKTYEFRFNYVSLPVLLSYAPEKYVTINSGIEYSRLISTSVEDGTHTYNRNDVGLILGLTFFDKRRLSIYSRVIYGLVPMLDYYTFDKLGNFTGKIHDLKNTCLSVGIKLNIYQDESRK